jgi:hypothetical protein
MTDEESIRRTIALWAQLCDDGKWDELCELHTSDTVWSVFDTVCRGPEELKDTLSRGMPPGRRGRHLCCASVIDVADGTADAVTDFLFINNQSGIQRVGRYHDQLVRGADHWLIKTREIRTMPPDA